MAKNREWSTRYLNQQYAAMRWLAKQGLTPSEIREFNWGQVDEFTHTVKIPKTIISLMYDPKSKNVYKKETEKPIKIDYRGSGNEWFFEKSGMYNICWAFTAHQPKSWRKEQGREAMFPLEVVEKVCQDLKLPEFNPLTFISDCANIEISKLNIQNLETAGQIKEAEIVAEAKEKIRSVISINP